MGRLVDKLRSLVLLYKKVYLYPFLCTSILVFFIFIKMYKECLTRCQTIHVEIGYTQHSRTHNTISVDLMSGNSNSFCLSTADVIITRINVLCSPIKINKSFPFLFGGYSSVPRYLLNQSLNVICFYL